MKILIVEVNWLGDVLFSTPAIKALRRKFPDSHIACLILPRVREVLEGNPHINELIVNDEDGLDKGFSGKMRLAGKLKRKKFDLVILFHRSFTRAMLTYLAGIPRRLGYRTFKRWLLLTGSLTMPKKDSQHRVDYYLNIVKSLGCNTQDRFYEFFVSPEDEKFVENFLSEERVSVNDSVVCLNPGGNWGPKRWPKENFARLADCLSSDYRAKIIFSGSEGDVALISEITARMKHKPIIAAGRTDLKQSACIFKKTDLVISGDSAPLHIAAAVGANIIGLFGPTSPAITGPIGKGKVIIIQKPFDCQVPCYDQNCADNKCMQEITVEDVVSELKDFYCNKNPKSQALNSKQILNPNSSNPKQPGLGHWDLEH